MIKNACGDKVIGGGCGRRATMQITPRMSIITAMSTGMAIMSTIIMMCVCQLCSKQQSLGLKLFLSKSSLYAGAKEPYSLLWEKSHRKRTAARGENICRDGYFFDLLGA